MKTQLLTAAGAALCIAGLSAPAAANSLPQQVDGSVSVAAHSADPGLVINIGGAGVFSGSLASVGDSFTVNNLFTVGTSEGSVNIGEDTVPYPITATFTFTDPAGAVGNPITGSTSGFIQLFTSCGLIAGGCGQVIWDGPSEFVFGNIGKLQVSLSNATFGTPGSAGVNGTFTLLAAVPEPSTWAMMILGFGAVGFMMRSRRRQNVSVSYA